MSTSSEFHSLSPMIKVYKINLDSHFYHAKVPACLPPPSSTASSAEAAAWSSIFTLLNLMFRCLNTGKISHWCCYWPLVVLFFFFFCYCCCSQSGWLWFQVLLSVQQCSPVIKWSLTSWLHFQMESTGARCPGLTLIASEKSMQKFQPSAAFATGTNLELWFHEWIKFTHQMLVNYL